MASDNKVLGNFDLTGIPSAARGIPQIEVTFDIDANGIVSVQAKDKASGKEQQIQIAANGGLSDADIKKMVTEAELNAGSDKKRRAFVESKNQCESLVEQLDRLLRDQEAGLSAPDKAAAEQTIAAARTAMAGTDHENLLQAIEHLEHASARLHEAAQKPQAGGADQPGAAPPKDHDAVDAEFEDVGHHG
jgi:molecular chaperone DnaK